MSSNALVEDALPKKVADLLVRLEQLDLGSLSTESTQMRRDIDSPLTLAVAGLPGAGKSAVINGLLGRIVAPAVSSQFVVAYQYGAELAAFAVLTDGRRIGLKPAVSKRAEVAYDTAVLELDRIQRVEISQPLDSLARLRVVESPRPPQDGQCGGLSVDLVLAVIKSVDAEDGLLLERCNRWSPTSADVVRPIGILNWSDEAGGARGDAPDLSKRNATELIDTLSATVSTVLPFIGAIAESEHGLGHAAEAELAKLVRLPFPELDRQLRSARAFASSSQDGSDEEITVRRQLLKSLGLFGVRAAIVAMAAGEVDEANEEASWLWTLSGAEDLRTLIYDLYLPNAGVVRSLGLLVEIENRLADCSVHADLAKAASEVDRVRSESHDLSEFLLSIELANETDLRLSPSECELLEMLIGRRGASPAQRLGSDVMATSAELLTVAHQRREELGHVVPRRRLARTAVRVASRSLDRVLDELTGNEVTTKDWSPK